MAKKREPSVYLPDSWFEKVEDDNVHKLEDAANRVAGNVDSEYNPGVLMRRDRNGRPVALIALRVPWGIAAQAKTGELTRAAAKAGMHVTRYRDG